LYSNPKKGIEQNIYIPQNFRRIFTTFYFLDTNHNSLFNPGAGPQLVLCHTLAFLGDLERGTEQLRKGGPVASGVAPAGADAAKHGASG